MVQDSARSPVGVGITAVLVAEARAAETSRDDRLFADPLAEAFVASAMARSEAIRSELQENAPIESVREARLAAVAVRTRFFDDYLEAAAQSGISQVVLLAAGLDARAFRLPWPEGVRLWEIDLPEVLDFKESVISQRGARSRCTRYTAPVDLREDWPSKLLGADFDPAMSTAWLAEGLLMYLAEADRDLLLERVRDLSGAGSRFAMDHRAGFLSAPKLVTPEDPSGDRAAADLRKLAKAAPSDPSLVDPAGWLVEHDWHAEVLPLPAVMARYGRPVPEALSAAEDGTRQGWLATCQRAGA